MTSHEGFQPASASAYGGPNWPQRTAHHIDEIGTVWADYRVWSEWAPLGAVLLHRPGEELDGVEDAESALMLEVPDPGRVAAQHDALADAYRAIGVVVHYVEPAQTPPPNQMFAADLMFMTPGGAILGRPASTTRAGEARWIARRLADLGIPILRTVAGEGLFEGADACWLDDETVLLGRGLRTNEDGAAQVADTLAEMGVEVLVVDLAHGAMHLMGEVRIVDEDLAWVRSYRTPWTAIEALRDAGYEVHFFPSEEENRRTMGHNFVTLGPRKILMPAGNPLSEAAYAGQGMEVVTVQVDEIVKAAGAIGCLTGVLSRSDGA